MKINFESKSYKFSKKEFTNFYDQLSKSSSYTQGYNLNLFEKNLKQYLKVQNCIVLSNAVSAMQMIVDVLDLNNEDEVIIPAHTYLASAYPFLSKTNKIKWADIDLKTRVTNLDLIKKKVTKKTKVIVIVHLYGFLIDLKPIVKFAKKNKIVLIEDAAQSIGCKIKNKHAGTFGDFSIISFQSQKNLTTLGEGGCLIFKEKKLNSIFKKLRHNGHENYKNQKNYWKPAMTNALLPYYKKNILPHNFCLPEINCIAGNYLLEKIDKINNKKRLNAKYIINKLHKISNFLEFNSEFSERNNFHLLVGFCKNINRDKLISILFKKYKIKCIVQYYPLYKYNLFKTIKKQVCDNSELFYKNMISFPFHSQITKKEIIYLSNSIIKSVKSIAKE